MSVPVAPRTVFAGNYLFAGAGAWALVAMVGAFFALPEYSYLHGKLTGDEASAGRAGLGLLIFAVLALVFAVLCVLLAALSGQGRNPARILIWVLGGVAICANAQFLLAGFFESLPWYRMLVILTSAATLLCAGAATTLLALPVSRAFYDAARQARLAARQQWRRPSSGYWPPPPTTPDTQL